MQYVTTEGTQGICPSGWHIPTYTQMIALVNNVNHLKAVKFIDESQAMDGYTPTNTSGFSALFTGERTNSGSFYYLNEDADFWSSKVNDNRAYYMYMHNDSNNIGFSSSGIKEYGYSVRCLKN